jgi:hypothetical protein
MPLLHLSQYKWATLVALRLSKWHTPGITGSDTTSRFVPLSLGKGNGFIIYLIIETPMQITAKIDDTKNPAGNPIMQGVRNS